MKKTNKLLQEGIKIIEVKQKHIKIADLANLGWAVVAVYEEDKLASDLDYEKRIYRAKRQDKRVAKRKRLAGSNAARKKVAAEDSVPVQPGTRGQNSQGSWPPVARLRLVGPFYRCAKWGQLVANCLKPKQLYRFTQPLVSKAGESLNNSYSICANSNTSHAVCSNTTDHEYSLKARHASLLHEDVDNKKE